MDRFLVHLTRRRQVPGHRWHEVRSGPFDPDRELAPRSAVESTVLPGADVVCDVTLECLSGGVMATGRVTAPWVGVCRRCAVPVRGVLDVTVRERFSRSEARGADAGEDEDEDAYPIVGDELDLRPMVCDAVVLELPLAPLCREECRGLCPWCACDQNVDTCTCEAPSDPRWANLAMLRTVR